MSTSTISERLRAAGWKCSLLPKTRGGITTWQATGTRAGDDDFVAQGETQAQAWQALWDVIDGACRSGPADSICRVVTHKGRYR